MTYQIAGVEINESLIQEAYAQTFCRVMKITSYDGSYQDINHIFYNSRQCQGDVLKAAKIIVQHADLELATSEVSRLTLEIEELQKSIDFDNETIKAIPDTTDAKVRIVLSKGKTVIASDIKHKEKLLLKLSSKVKVENTILSATVILEALLNKLTDTD